MCGLLNAMARHLGSRGLTAGPTGTSLASLWAPHLGLPSGLSPGLPPGLPSGFPPGIPSGVLSGIPQGSCKYGALGSAGLLGQLYKVGLSLSSLYELGNHPEARGS